MVTKSEVFKSKYTKASDLKDGPVVGKIRVAALETVKGFNGTEEKLVVFFARGLKPLIVNSTNWDAITGIAGTDETNDWPGVEIELYAATAEVKGETKDCVRVRKPTAKADKKTKTATATASADDNMNDAIPF